MLKKTISPELYRFLRSIQPEIIPEDHQVKIANLGILNIFCVQNRDLSELDVFGNYIIEFTNAEFIDMTVAPNNIAAILELLSQ